MADELFFPPYLSKGSKGPPVALLQCLLLLMMCNERIVVDGDYDEETAAGVRKLQKDLVVEEDGNFGPQTRTALADESWLDVNKIPATAFSGPTEAVGPD